MAVKLLSNTTLRASHSLQHPTLVHLSIFDCAAFDLHVPTLSVFLPPTPSNDSLKSGLSSVLSYFPHLAGRLSSDEHRRAFIVLNNCGIRFIEASVSAALSEKLPLEKTSELSELHPAVGSGVAELLQIQLNRYDCGGLVIGATSHHRVGDGQSMSSFFAAWTRMVRFGNAPNPPPFLDRDAIVVPRNPLKCEFNHWEIEFKSAATALKQAACIVENLKISFSASFISKLKALVPGRCSTFEALLAHLWRTISSARGLRSDATSKVRVAVNGRTRLSSISVPPEFFGNLVLWAHPTATIKEILQSTPIGQANAVRLIREAVEKIDDGYFRSFIDFGEAEKGREEGMVPAVPGIGNVLCPNLEVDSWLRFDFHNLDFGSGSPCAFLPPNLPVEGLMVFVPSMMENGAVDVFMALAAEHVEEFKRICYSVD